MRIRWLVAALLGTAPLLSQQPLDEAWRLVRSGQRAQAEQLLTQILRRDPKNAGARLLYGSLLMEDGRKEDSIMQLEEGVHLDPQSAEGRNALGEAYENFGETAAAEEAFEKAVALNPKLAVAHTNLGLVLLQSGKLDAAAQQLEKSIALLGKSADAAYPRYLRAKVYSAQNQPQQAANELKAAVALKPDFAEAWSDLGEARKATLNDDAALSAFERAVKLNPKDAVAQYRLGAEYLHRQKAHAAVEHLEAADQIRPHDQSTLNALQSALRQDGKQEEANKIRRQLAQLLRDKDVANQNALASVRANNEGAELEKAGNLREALTKYQKAVRLNPEHVGMRVNYAVALLRLGQWTEGLNQLHEALKRDPHNEKIQAALKDALSQAPPNLVPDWHDEWSQAAHPSPK